LRASHGRASSIGRSGPSKDEAWTMMNGYDSIFSVMWGMGLTWLVLLVLAVLAIAALIKYLSD
jgi:hypothetical protein